MDTTDVVIIGGGPAGSVLGCYLASAGIDTVILEKVRHPRPHVGESLVPSTTRIFKEIDFLSTMEKEGFVKKYGAAWHSVARNSEIAIRFSEYRQPGVDQDYTYHVDRGRFDQLLFLHARASGAKVLEDAHVREVHFESGRAVGVTFSANGLKKRLNAHCVVDASGRACVLGTRLRLKQKDPLFDQFAVHSWFQGVRRGTGETRDFIHIYFLPVKRGWAWQIPITDKITSMGVVTDKSVFRRSKGRLETWFRETAATSPDLANALRGATRVRPYRPEADYSYSMKRFTGDGFLLIGDAARFVDPIFSSGVSVACYSARFASQVLLEALAERDVTRARLSTYEARLRAGVDIWYEFIRLYYKLMHLFSYFIEDPRYRHQIHQLLQGEVYDRSSAPVLDRMKRVIRTVEKTPGHIWQPFLTDIPV